MACSSDLLELFGELRNGRKKHRMKMTLERIEGNAKKKIGNTSLNLRSKVRQYKVQQELVAKNYLTGLCFMDSKVSPTSCFVRMVKSSR